MDVPNRNLGAVANIADGYRTWPEALLAAIGEITAERPPYPHEYTKIAKWTIKIA